LVKRPGRSSRSGGSQQGDQGDQEEVNREIREIRGKAKILLNLLDLPLASLPDQGDQEES
jgi:hypothetical protein